MDNITRAYYEISFENNYLKKKGNEFQDFFSEIMEKRYRGDFQRVTPWGNVGDRKNDGYLKSEKTLFQVYAPNEMTASEATEKIETDFKEALPYWEEYFDKWVFVHNSRRGLGPQVLKSLLELGTSYSDIKITHYGFEEIKDLVFSLSDWDICSLLGPAPSNDNFLNVGFEDLKVVLLDIARKEPTGEPDLRPVPKDKLEANALSPSVETLLITGMRKANLVENFLNKWHDPYLGDRIAEAFRIKYRELKEEGLPPDIIFMRLQEFAGGAKRGTPEHEAAVLAVLAFYFEKCDIFERPRKGDSL